MFYGFDEMMGDILKFGVVGILEIWIIIWIVLVEWKLFDFIFEFGS